MANPEYVSTHNASAIDIGLTKAQQLPDISGSSGGELLAVTESKDGYELTAMLSLPEISGGSAGKLLVVTDDESGYSISDKTLTSAITVYNDQVDYIANQSYVMGSNSFLYRCLINNGSSSTPVNPVDDVTGSWIQAAIATPPPYLKYSDVKATTVAGGTAIAGVQTRTLTTEDADTDNIGSLSSNQITLPQGTYTVHFSCPAAECSYNRAFLYNVTDDEILLLGQSQRAISNVSTVSIGYGLISLSDTKVLELRHYIRDYRHVLGLGTPVSDGNDEVYSMIELFKKS